MGAKITKEQWAAIEKRLRGSWGCVVFIYKGKVINVNRVRQSESKTVLVVYIGGEIKGSWFLEKDGKLEEPLVKELWRKRSIAVYKPKEKAKLIKAFGKRGVKEYFPNIDKVTIMYDSNFNTAKSLCSKFKKLDGLVLVTEIKE